jgi:hypothetical protein
MEQIILGVVAPCRPVAHGLRDRAVWCAAVMSSAVPHDPTDLSRARS